MVEPHTHSRVLWRGDGRSSLLVQELCTRDTATSGLRRAGMRFGLNLCPGWFGFYTFAISCVPFSVPHFRHHCLNARHVFVGGVIRV